MQDIPCAIAPSVAPSTVTSLSTPHHSPSFIGSKSPNGYLLKGEERNFATNHESNNSNKSSAALSDSGDSTCRDSTDGKSVNSISGNFEANSQCMLGKQRSSDYSSLGYKDSSKLVNGKKSRCKECEGCRAQDCGQCTYCLDKKKFGGQNVIKQACKFRVCIRFKNGPKANQQMGEASPNPVSSSSTATNASVPPPMSPPSSKHLISNNNHLGKGSCSRAIQSPSFFPTPPPHSNSQHNSPSSVASSQGHCNLVPPSPLAPLSSMSNGMPMPSMSNYGNAMSHLSSLPTPTSSPLSQNHLVSPYHPKPGELAASLCEYSTLATPSPYSHYVALGEPVSVGSAGNSFESNSLPTAACSYPCNNYESSMSRSNLSNLGQQYNSNSLNYYQPMSNLNFNLNPQFPSSSKSSRPKVSPVSSQVNYSQYHANCEYPLGSSNYKSNCLYFGDYASAGQQASKGNWHAPTYPLANNHYQVGAPSTFTTTPPSTLTHFPFSPKTTDTSLGNSFYGHQHSNLSCHNNYYDGYY